LRLLEEGVDGRWLGKVWWRWPESPFVACFWRLGVDQVMEPP